MRAFVDRDACIGCGACEGICPEVFSMDSEGISVPINEEIVENLIESAREAEESCPVSVISIK